MQANMPKLANMLDVYMRTILWKRTIDYMVDDNWRTLMLDDVASFIIKETLRVVYEY
jgi:hypothetical protein